MAPNFFGASSRETSSVTYFEIRLDKSNIILRGTENEACSAVLKGTLVLCLSEALRIQGIRLRFTGELRLGWFQAGGASANHVKHEEEFMRRTWDFKRSSETLPAGNYEWPFDIILPGQTSESVEGLSDSWVIYRMKATIERGMLQQNVLARRQVRVIRTLNSGALELAHVMSIDNVWPNKLEYSLSTPMKAVIFGSNIRVDFKFLLLLKGLEIVKVTTKLNEKQEMTIKSSRTRIRSPPMVREIAKDEMDNVEMEDIEGQEGYVFSRNIAVPQTLKKCVQTADVLGIKVGHSLCLTVRLRNPDGHFSELHATLPVHIFLSPNLPIDDDNNLVNQGHRNSITYTGLSDLTPPQYGEHQFDQLYSDIDLSGYLTPPGAASGINTPSQSRSRSISTDNLASMNAMASNEFAANILQNRLISLDAAGLNRTARDRSQLSGLGDSTGEQPGREAYGGISTPRHGSSSNSDCLLPAEVDTQPQYGPGEALSRRESEEDDSASGAATPQHVEYGAEVLSRVPSYTTALQANPRTPLSEGLPSYHTAMRGPLPLPSTSQGTSPLPDRNVGGA